LVVARYTTRDDRDAVWTGIFAAKGVELGRWSEVGKSWRLFWDSRGLTLATELLLSRLFLELSSAHPAACLAKRLCRL
jgi:hypothetical protein